MFININTIHGLTNEQVMKAEIWNNNFLGKMFGSNSSKKYWEELTGGMDGCRDGIS